MQQPPWRPTMESAPGSSCLPLSAPGCGVEWALDPGAQPRVCRKPSAFFWSSPVSTLCSGQGSTCTVSTGRVQAPHLPSHSQWPSDPPRGLVFPAEGPRIGAPSLGFKPLTPQDGVRWCMTVYGGVWGIWQCMMVYEVYDGVWQCKMVYEVYDSVWQCMVLYEVYDSVWWCVRCMMTCDSVWWCVRCMMMYDSAWWCMRCVILYDGVWWCMRYMTVYDGVW